MKLFMMIMVMANVVFAETYTTHDGKVVELVVPTYKSEHVTQQQAKSFVGKTLKDFESAYSYQYSKVKVTMFSNNINWIMKEYKYNNCRIIINAYDNEIGEIFYYNY